MRNKYGYRKKHNNKKEGDPKVILFLSGGVNKKQSSRLVQASIPQFTKRK